MQGSNRRGAAFPQGFVFVSAVLWLAACTPALDWREWRPEGSGVQLLLPCKPVPQVRNVLLAGMPVRLALHACSAGGQTWAVAFTDVADPARVGPALVELRDSAMANIAGTGGTLVPWVMQGATPHPENRRLRLQGKLPDGTAVHEQVAVFAVGTKVFQATVLGAQLPDDALDSFFGSLRALP